MSHMPSPSPAPRHLTRQQVAAAAAASAAAIAAGGVDHDADKASTLIDKAYLDQLERSLRVKDRRLADDKYYEALHGRTAELAKVTDEMMAFASMDWSNMEVGDIKTKFQSIIELHQDAVCREALDDQTARTEKASDKADKQLATREANARSQASAKGMTAAEEEVHVAKAVAMELGKQRAAAAQKDANVLAEYDDKIAKAEKKKQDAIAAKEAAEAEAEISAAAEVAAATPTPSNADSAVGPSSAIMDTSASKKKRKGKREIVAEQGEQAWEHAKQQKKLKSEEAAEAKRLKIIKEFEQSEEQINMKYENELMGDEIEVLNKKVETLTEQVSTLTKKNKALSKKGGKEEGSTSTTADMEEQMGKLKQMAELNKARCKAAFRELRQYDSAMVTQIMKKDYPTPPELMKQK